MTDRPADRQPAYQARQRPGRQAEHDGAQAGGSPPPFSMDIIPSRRAAPALAEPQVIYLLVQVKALSARDLPVAPLNLCLVIDRSTSMKGERLNRVKAAVMQIIDSLGPQDAFAVVAFSDRAEIVIPSTQGVDRSWAKAKVSTMWAGGGTEILQGLAYGLGELHRSHNPAAVNHLVLLTDGRTYGDEADCLMLADTAEREGFVISGLGIGEEWNDVFLDDLAGRTGGHTAYVDGPEAVERVLGDWLRGASNVFAEHVKLQVSPNPGVTLQSAFKLAPTAQPLSAEQGLLLAGALHLDRPLQVLLQLLLAPMQPGRHHLARISISADVLRLGQLGAQAAADFEIDVVRDPAPAAPPVAIVEALGKLTLYQMQEKARQEAEAGETALATRRLERLSARLFAAGEQALAQEALAEANRLTQSERLSSEGQKRLKYGTRALIAPS